MDLAIQTIGNDRTVRNDTTVDLKKNQQSTFSNTS